jgi:hypothetical protein
MERGRGAHSNIALNMNGCSRIMKRLDDGYLTTPTSFLERCEAKLPQRRRGEGAEGEMELGGFLTELTSSRETSHCSRVLRQRRFPVYRQTRCRGVSRVWST